MNPGSAVHPRSVVTAQTQYSLANARSYFSEHLAMGDYYAESNQVIGEWFGVGAQRLGLGMVVRSEPFLRLCENRHPTLDQSFTHRTNTVRATAEGTTANRRVFYDFTFSPPKSVSIAGLVAGDDRILHAHDLAVRAALAEFEVFAGVRVRKDASSGSRRTGNLVAALFRHTTSRALDPHVHTHAVVFNGSWDPVEGRWKALENQDPVVVFRGGAGTGKSFVFRQLVDQLQRSGKAPVVLAPQRQQVVEMEQAGFPTPATVAQFLGQPDVQRGGVLVVDEAGQIGGKQMLALLDVAQAAGARVILSGDTRQHGPVEASDALVAIERHSGIRPVELKAIRRQDPELASSDSEKTFIRGYRAAVELAAQGETRASFDALADLGAIIPCPAGTQAEALATEYLRLAQTGAATVVVSQTWSEVHQVNDRIRRALKDKGLLGSHETRVTALDRLDLTSAQKRDERFYPPDAVVTFNRPFRGLPAGTVGKVVAFLPTEVLIESAHQVVKVPAQSLDRFTVALPTEIPLSAGDRLQLKANRTLNSGKRVSNGELVTVKRVSARGTIELEDGRVLDRSYAEFLPGYAVTSYGSQGKTVDHVLLSDSTSKPATSAEQWYVSISRGRRSVRIFTPDPDQLRENVVRSGHRRLALDLKRPGSYPRRAVGRWMVLRDRLTRFGSTTLQRLQDLRFFKSRHTPSSYAHHTQRTRNVGH